MGHWYKASPRQQTLQSQSIWVRTESSCSEKGILYRQARPRESEVTLLQLVLPTAYREVALRGCHDEVGYLGLECMLDLMCDRFFWPCMAAQAKEHVGRCCLCLVFKARQQKLPLKISWPLILLSWSTSITCVWSLEENVLVITGPFH